MSTNYKNLAINNCLKEACLFFKNHLTDENIKNHIIIKNNLPTYDKVWLMQIFTEAIAMASIESRSNNSLLSIFINAINIIKNIKKTKINLHYQNNFKKLLDDIDLKIDEINQGIANNPDIDKDILLASIKSIHDRLFDDFLNLCNEYNDKYNSV